MRGVISLVGMGIGGILMLGYMFVGTAEGRSAIADMERAEAAMCACDVGDLQCAMQAQAMIEEMMLVHGEAQGTELQLQRFEQSAERTVVCMERVFGS
jgi:hypothetical protein